MLGQWMWLCTTAFAQSQPADPSSPAASRVPVVVWLQVESPDGPVAERFVTPLAQLDAVEVEVVTSDVVERAVNRRASSGEGPRVEVVVGSLYDEGVDCFDDGVLEARVRRLTSAAGRSGIADHVAVGLVRTTMEPVEEEDDEDGPARPPWAVLERSDAGCIEVVDDAASSEPSTLTNAVVGLGFGVADGVLQARLGAVSVALGGSAHEVQLVPVPVPDGPVAVHGWVRVRDHPVVTWTMPPPSPWNGCDDPRAEVALSVGGKAVRSVGTATCEGTVELSLSRTELQRRFLETAGPDPRVRKLTSRGVVTVRAGSQALDEQWAAVSALNESSRPLPWWDHARDAFAVRPWSRRVTVSALDLVGLDRRPFVEALAAAAGVWVALFWWVTRTMYRARVRRSLRRAWREGVHGSDPLRARPAGAVLEEGWLRAARGGRLGRWLVGLGAGAGGAAAVGWSVLRVFEVWGG